MPDHGILDAGAMVTGLRERLSARIADRLAPPTPPKRRRLPPLSVDRSPCFCSDVPTTDRQGPRRHPCRGQHRFHGMVLLMDDGKVDDIAGITAASRRSQFINDPVR